MMLARLTFFFTFAFNAWVASLGLVSPATAGVVIDGTRVVYPGQKREVSINVHNNGETPSLVQVWLDTGNPQSKPGEDKVPFLLTPPLFRLDPTKGQSLRLFYTQEPLPVDRESLFWLNVLDIPPRAPADPNKPNKLEFAFKHRIKVFFRPDNLPGTAAGAPAQLTWKLVAKDGQTALEVTNPTPYHVSFAQVTAIVGEDAFNLKADMVGPFASRTFGLPKQDVEPAGLLRVDYSFINDYGGIAEATFKVPTAR
ncbi:fimbria/pilus periplasmic chaperone [Methylobacter sp.]|uniref:fimbria/pilus periplasmic chaperone n=1 Tax=Methylobacter sp. TaxID=2051955 RepID=UPI003DA55F22